MSASDQFPNFTRRPDVRTPDPRPNQAEVSSLTAEVGELKSQLQQVMSLQQDLCGVSGSAPEETHPLQTSTVELFFFDPGQFFGALFIKKLAPLR